MTQSNESSAVTGPGMSLGIATSDMHAATALIPTAEEAVRLAMAPSAEALAGGSTDQEVRPETLVPRADRAGTLAGGAPVLSFPPRPSPARPTAMLHALQEWEGYVIEMNSDEFVARLVDLTAGSTHEEEEAVIPQAEVSECDVATMGVGSIFRWVIGYERSPAGTKKRVSQIVFRDLPRMAERDFRDGRSWARETMRAFKL